MPHIHELYDFTVSAFILHPTEKKLCLLLHNKLQRWLQPGGHVELDENPWQALEHELFEETGLDLNRCKLLLQPDMPHARGNTRLPIPFYINEHPMGNLPSHTHIDSTYLLRSYTEELVLNPKESSSIGWLTLNQIKKHNQDGVLFDATLDISEWIFDRLGTSAD